MALLPKAVEVIKLSEQDTIENHRPYIGYSSAGEPCDRALWYGFHWINKRIISSKLKRIFDTGHIMEHFMTRALIDAGMLIYDEQVEIIGPHGHVKGHIDGKCKGVPLYEDLEHLLELKTMNEKNFKMVIKKGVKSGFLKYYSQMQAYMGNLDMSCALFVAYNKNTSEIYLERVLFDKPHFDMLESKLTGVLYSEFPLDKIGEKTWFTCKFCDFYDICHNEAPIDKNCRTCKNSNIEENGKWSCEAHDKELSTEDQRKGCVLWKNLID